MALPWRPTVGAPVVLAPVTKTACAACYQQRSGVVVTVTTAGVTVRLGDGTRITTHERNVRSAHHPSATTTAPTRRSTPAVRRTAIDPAARHRNHHLRLPRRSLTMATYRFDRFTDLPHTLTLDRIGRDGNGRTRWRYQLTAGTEVVFTGTDLYSPPHDGEDQAARAALGFLTLRPGDTDADYFDDYTPAQEVWRDAHAENLSMVLYAEHGSDVADLREYRTAEEPAPSGYAVDCHACELFGEPVQHADHAGQLAATHDDIHHRGHPTAQPVPVTEDDRDTRCGVGECAGTQRVVPGTEHIDADGSAMATTRCDAGPHEGAAYWTAGSEAPEVSPASDAEFLAGCERYARTLRGVAEGLHEWINTLHAMALPTTVLDPLHTAAVAVDAAATDLANAAASFTDEFDTARDVAARGLTITGE